MLFVSATNKISPVVGVGIDDVLGDVATEILHDPAITDAIPQMCCKKVPEVVWCDVLAGFGTLNVPSGCFSVLTYGVSKLIYRESLAPIVLCRDE